MKKIAVLAGNHAEFQDYFRDAVNKNEQLYYISGLNSIIGQRFDAYMVWGTFWERKDASKLYDEVAARVLYENPDLLK